MAIDPLDALPDGVVLAGPDGSVTVTNAVACRMLGVEDAVGRPLADVLVLLDTDGRAWVDANEPYAGLVTRTGVPEQSWLLPDGTEVLTHARLHRDRPGGAVTGVAITMRSGRGRARLDRERSDLVATVAHELRSPLTGVKGFVQALLNRWDKLNDEQKKLMLTTVSVDSDRLSRLIAELLDVARLDTGRLQLHPRPSDAAVLTERVVNSVQQTATSRQIVLKADPDLPSITVDPDKFTQVVTNLVENAVRHGEGTVSITLGADGDPDRRGRGRGHPGRAAQAGLHQVLEGRRERRLRPGALPRRRSGEGPRRHGDGHGRRRWRCPDRDHVAARERLRVTGHVSGRFAHLARRRDLVSA